MKISKELFDSLCELRFAYLDENGREMNNPTPMVIDANFERPPTLKEQIQRVLKTELSRQAYEKGNESFEEANDFDIDEDPFPSSPYEVQDMIDDPEPNPPEPPNKLGGSEGAEPPKGEATGDETPPSPTE